MIWTSILPNKIRPLMTLTKQKMWFSFSLLKEIFCLIRSTLSSWPYGSDRCNPYLYKAERQMRPSFSPDSSTSMNWAMTSSTLTRWPIIPWNAFRLVCQHFWGHQPIEKGTKVTWCLAETEATRNAQICFFLNWLIFFNPPNHSVQAPKIYFCLHCWKKKNRQSI